MDVQLDQAAAAFWEYFARLLDTADLGPGWPTSDERYFRFSGRGLITGKTGLAPAVRFESDTYVPVSEIKFEEISGQDRHELHDAWPLLQQRYGGPGIVRVENAGDTVYIKVVGDGSPADRDRWPDYAQWFITTQRHLRAALAAFYRPSAVAGGHSPPQQQRVTEARVSEGLVEALNAKAQHARGTARHPDGRAVTGQARDGPRRAAHRTGDWLCGGEQGPHVHRYYRAGPLPRGDRWVSVPSGNGGRERVQAGGVPHRRRRRAARPTLRTLIHPTGLSSGPPSGPAMRPCRRGGATGSSTGPIVAVSSPSPAALSLWRAGPGRHRYDLIR